MAVPHTNASNEFRARPPRPKMTAPAPSPNKNTRRPIVPVNDSRKGFSPHDKALFFALPVRMNLVGDVKRVHESSAKLPERQNAGKPRNAKPVPAADHAELGKNLIGSRGGDNNQVNITDIAVGVLERRRGRHVPPDHKLIRFHLRCDGIRMPGPNKDSTREWYQLFPQVS